MLCFLGSIWSQEAFISGLVINSHDQTPIHGTNIYIENLSVGTISKVDGRFSLDGLPKQPIELTISMIGYKDVIKSLNLILDETDIGTIVMERDTLAIEEIVVDAHHELQPSSFASTIEFSGHEYHKGLKGSLASTLEKETGLSIRSMGQGTTQPVLRGYTGDRFLLTVDGITVGDLSNTSVDHTVSMDMASFNKVRVIRGPESLLYGSNTIGGVINVSRQSNSDARFKKASLQANVGSESSNSSAFGNVMAYLPINYQNQLRLSILGRQAANQSSPLGILENTALSNVELTGSYSYFGNSYRSTFSYEQIAMNYGIPGSYEGHIDGVDIEMVKQTQKYNLHKDISLFGFRTFDLDQRFINYKHDEIEKGSEIPSVIMGQKILSLQGRLSGSNLNIGSLFQYRNYQAGGFYWTPDAEELNLALFGMVESKYNDILFQISSRAEYLSVIPETSSLNLSNLNPHQVLTRDFKTLSAAIGLFRSWNHWELSLGTMLTGRTPSIEDLFSDGPHLGTYAYEIGQPLLEMEQTLGVEGSIEYQSEKR